MPARPDIRDVERRWTDRVTALHELQSADARAFSRELRQQMTPAEEAMWELLRANKLGVKFRRQHPLGKYVADFYCHRARLVIELDGDAHQDKEHKDGAREDWMRLQGLVVVRFRNEAVLHEPGRIVESVRGWIERRFNELDASSKSESGENTKNQ